MLSRIIFAAAMLFLSDCCTSAQDRPPRVLIDEAQRLIREEEFGNAKPLLERAEAQLRGKRGFEYATTLAMLGRVLAETDDAALAITNIHRALELFRGSSAPEATIASAEYALARAYLKQQRFVDALPLLKRIVERSNTSKSAVSRLTIAGALRDLGHVAIETQDWRGGQALLSNALSLLEREFGDNDRRLIPVLNDLGLAAINLRQPAASYFERSLSIASPLQPEAQVVPMERLMQLLEETPGVSEKATVEWACGLLKVYIHVTDDYLKFKRWGSSKPIVTKLVILAMRIDTGNCEDLTFLALGFNHLANRFLELGLYLEASELLKVAAVSWERIGGENSEETILSLRSLAMSYQRQARLQEAEGIFLRVLELLERFDDPVAPDRGRARKIYLFAIVWNDLGEVWQQLALRSQQTLSKAEQAYRRALSLIGSLVESEPRKKREYLRSKSTTLGNLAVLLSILKREQESAAAAREAFSLFETFAEPDDPGIPTLFALLIRNAIRANQFSDAETLALRAIALREAALGPDDPQLVPLLNFLKDARLSLGRTQAAYDASKRAAEILIRLTSRVSVPEYSEVLQADFPNVYTEHILSAYLLSREAVRNLAALRDEAFGMAQRLIVSNTASALLQAAARQAQGLGPIAELLRERQDRLVEITSLDKSLASEFARPSSQRNEKQEAELHRRSIEARARVTELDVKIARDFPRFAELWAQQPVSIEEAQKLLADNEALILIASDGREPKTLAWALTRRAVQWVELPIWGEKISASIQALRCGLDAEEWAGTTRANQCAARLRRNEGVDDDGLLPFHLGIAHELYLSLFGPVGDLIKGKRLLVVPSGPLTSLPLHVLVTQKPATAIPATFEGYRNVAWLGRSHAITVLPSVQSLKALRGQSANRQTASADYIGIGNPVLKGTPGECRDNVKVPQHCPEVAGGRLEMIAASGGRATIRGDTGRRSAGKGLRQIYARGTGAAVLKEVRSLCPLPDTAFELRCVAERFPQGRHDLLLDKNATEAELRKLNASGTLARYRIVHFATHGLVAADLETLAKRQSEPALVLTPPEQPLDADDDGLLSASEVAQLRLNADWVVLSACSTAAGDGANAEALSGLARAFFYAGTRALLVSHWPVYSDAAVQLTTRTFAELDSNPGIGRAEAFRRAMLVLMGDPALPSNAHPAVWAPFVVVGEGGSDEYTQIPLLLRPPTPVTPRTAPAKK
jgi:CHAT domain-containing protein